MTRKRYISAITICKINNIDSWLVMNIKTLLFCSFLMLSSIKWEFNVLNQILCLLFSTLRFYLKTKVLSSGHGTWFTKENNYACILEHLLKSLEADVALTTHYCIKRKRINKWDRYNCSFVLKRISYPFRMAAENGSTVLCIERAIYWLNGTRRCTDIKQWLLNQ